MQLEQLSFIGQDVYDSSCSTWFFRKILWHTTTPTTSAAYATETVSDVQGVLTTGVGYEGILQLGEWGVVVDGHYINEYLADPGVSIALTQYGELIDAENLEIGSITALDGSALTAGEADAVRINFVDGSHTDLVLGGSEFSFMLTPPGTGQEWSMDCLDIKLDSYESLSESPGTIFLIEQLCQQLYDSANLGVVPGSSLPVYEFVANPSGLIPTGNVDVTSPMQLWVNNLTQQVSQGYSGQFTAVEGSGWQIMTI